MDDRAVNRLLLQCVADRERVKAKIVDVARDALAPRRDQRPSLWFEQGPALMPGHLQPMVDIAVDLFGAEWLETSQDGDALPELGEVGPGQLLGQLGLTREHDLHQLRARRLKI